MSHPFADDIIMCNSISNIIKFVFQVNSCLVNVQEYADHRKLNFKASKSSNCLFTTNRHLRRKYPSYLGFALDPEVNWNKHLEKLADILG